MDMGGTPLPPFTDKILKIVFDGLCLVFDYLLKEIKPQLVLFCHGCWLPKTFNKQRQQMCFMHL